MLRSFAGGRLFGARYGDGPPWLLALHGWQRSHRDFEGVIVGRPGDGSSGDGPTAEGPTAEGPTTESTALDAVALDLPGFGASPP
ncbi:MAG: hypothetical protein J2P59_07135, partial [Acidimicrobiales bacterium]|nr:hypothetical protein [Acidimicrobiales bacterium]